MKIYKNKLASGGVHFSFFNRRLGSDIGRSYVKQVLFHFMFEPLKSIRHHIKHLAQPIEVCACTIVYLQVRL